MPRLSSGKAIELIKSDEGKFYHNTHLHYNMTIPIYCDHCTKEIIGGCIGNTDVGEEGVDVCLKCVSDLCVIISRRYNSSSSDTDSDSDTSSSDTNTNTNTNTNTIDDVRKKVCRQM